MRPAKDLCSDCGLCDSRWVAYVRQACAFLHQDFDVALFDQNNHVGGHSNTVTVPENGVELPVDTGFMVYNEVTYPNLTRLF